MRIIPAIDIINGKCVRLTKGDYTTKKIYSENPVNTAKQFEDNGIKFLHLVDLDGAKSDHIINYKILKKICTQTNLKVDFGGGLKSDDDVKIAFDSGAAQITGGSIAASKPGTFLRWLKAYGNEKIILGADSKNYKISTNGWMKQYGHNVIEYIETYEAHGFKYVIATDISKDGMLEGSSIKLYKNILERTNVKLIASGGVKSIDELQELKTIGCEGVIIGKAIYEGLITLKELQQLC